MTHSAQLDLIAPPPPLCRQEALRRLDEMVGVDLRPLAETHGITVWRDGQRNKGWAGQVVERLLGRSPNSEKAADFGDWELKVVSVLPDAEGRPRVKESMALAMFNPAEIEADGFDESHVLSKLDRLLVVARWFDGPDEAYAPVVGAAAFDLTDATLRARVNDDYDEIRWVVRSQGVHALHGGIGALIQARPKGDGRLAFYARARFVSFMLGLAEAP
ncbi:MAG: hypothetical protein KC620_11515 [Myxococcales bacterium]|nr:hypothetical protein [Myxococcales bacterium]